MDKQGQEKKPVMDKILDEVELKAGKPDLVPGFLGRVSSASFRRPRPFEHHVTPDGPNLTTDDWTVPHD